ncbi:MULTISPECIES: hypothetical protein [unclassified Streptomyces]|uniref:hypothetical protein n=1 Tax=unclassified Streptomyces TaxID=2593676 RepID=UPI00236648CB|nr:MULTISPECIES: hypothetical protein [unclassified Streptomyces]MDF3140860.1 hypothetical protein [Streptomyces sp. T21Q-yed]WDF40372.1 hypothetical protein PBV52_28115 [Streptomyces sp. T12]
MTTDKGTAVDVQTEGRGHDRTRVVTIDNKDSGDTIKLRREVTDTIESIIAAMYEEFRRVRDAEDRLTCRRNGEDVFQFASLTLEEYLRQGHCQDLHWSFVGGTGGA